MSLVRQVPRTAPSCPHSGITGGPIHPAHAARMEAMERVESQVRRIAEDTPTSDWVNVALYEPKMNLFQTMATIDPAYSTIGGYIVAYYWQCLTCGFVLPAQYVSRP